MIFCIFALKYSAMETIIIKSANKAHTKMIVEIARKFKMKAEISTDTPNEVTIKAINDAVTGRVHKTKSVKELMEKLSK
jgi:antitoxin component of RelBE/YafQ-DinJ toxin-antitoxin module